MTSPGSDLMRRDPFRILMRCVTPRTEVRGCPGCVPDEALTADLMRLPCEAEPRVRMSNPEMS